MLNVLSGINNEYNMYLILFEEVVYGLLLLLSLVLKVLFFSKLKFEMKEINIKETYFYFLLIFRINVNSTYYTTIFYIH